MMISNILLIWFTAFHPFYVSMTEIEQSAKTKSVQVSTRIFFDDLEKAIDRKYKTSINILKPKDKAQVDKLITAYVKDHLKIKANGVELELKYLGYEIEEEAAWCYFETQAVPLVKRFTISNNILYEQHESQINMIHAVVEGKRQSTKLDNPDSKAEFSY